LLLEADRRPVVRVAALLYAQYAKYMSVIIIIIIIIIITIIIFRLMRLRQTAQPYKHNVQLVCNIEKQSAMVGSNDTAHTLSSRIAATTKLSTGGG